MNRNSSIFLIIFIISVFITKIIVISEISGFDDVWGDSDTDFVLGTIYHKIQLEEDISSPYELVQLLRKELVGDMWERNEYFASNFIDSLDGQKQINAFANWQKNYVKTIAKYGAGAGEAFTMVAGIVNEPLDIVISLNEVANGNYAAAVGLLPFIPGSASKVIKFVDKAKNVKIVIPKGAKYYFDARTNNYVETATGKFTKAENLPWPGKNGFITITPKTLNPGTTIDRYGKHSGKYAGSPGTTIAQRGMPPGSELMQYTKFEVVKPLPVDAGAAAPVKEYGAVGGALQYELKMPISELLKQGYLKIVK